MNSKQINTHSYVEVKQADTKVSADLKVSALVLDPLNLHKDNRPCLSYLQAGGQQRSPAARRGGIYRLNDRELWTP